MYGLKLEIYICKQGGGMEPPPCLHIHGFAGLRLFRGSCGSRFNPFDLRIMYIIYKFIKYEFNYVNARLIPAGTFTVQNELY